MRHRVKKSFFNRGTKHRQAMLRGGVRNLILHGKISTTMAKAKEFKRLTDKIIYKAMQDSVASRRKLHQFFGKRDIVNTLVDQVAPSFEKRQSGFTRITKIGRRRGDNTEMVKLELLVKRDEMGTFKKPVADKKPVAKKTTAKKVADKKSTPKKKPAAKKTVVSNRSVKPSKVAPKTKQGEGSNRRKNLGV
ncbi:MAG: 50S ribosomal protein L17 [Candidatus Pacebacteria bacterium]|jgi:large subunit ribosomal protein L17|nr:50S ribosomal protein L17 [Candidatus Paceibacterota bacterium]MBT3511507.1 50S ribosomal protein L17 [Candidatus Paceibacterota bacterium]MBT4005023.1 50S ribosomal protein L17 [Candidatus Paceibacterota bacterium]MBT4358799.1 50S ribosomal protein L17 [Candidatus Paceibacterota bacterium]MBT4680607.1 50S ribosomal protein L17 [Candidatus Paceibacterota bacterium]